MGTLTDNLPHFDAESRPVWKFDLPPTHSGQHLGQRLVEIHGQIRSEAQKLLAFVKNVTQEGKNVDSARLALESLWLRQNYQGLGGFCTGYCELLSIHHANEDKQVFPRLAKFHPGLMPVLKQLNDEHEVLAALIQRLGAALSPPTLQNETCEPLEVITDCLVEQLLSHLDYEESQLVAILDATDSLLPTERHVAKLDGS